MDLELQEIKSFFQKCLRLHAFEAANVEQATAFPGVMRRFWGIIVSPPPPLCFPQDQATK
jgi:hypothetical protein